MRQGFGPVKAGERELHSLLGKEDRFVVHGAVQDVEYLHRALLDAIEDQLRA